MAEGTLTRKGQITIPKSVRDALDLKAGDRLTFRVEGDYLVGRVRRVPDVMETFHRLPGARPVPGAGAEDAAWRVAALAKEQKRRSAG